MKLFKLEYILSLTYILLVKVTSYKKTIKKLKSKGTYYVKVRAYKAVSGTKHYGDYCSANNLKIQ